MIRQEASRRSRVAALALWLVGALSGASFAERAVGTEARGVDPAWVLHNRWDLDVRDADGRPVSRRMIEAELGAAARKAAVENSYVSRLPQARAMAAALQVVRLVKFAWRASAPGVLRRLHWAFLAARRGAARVFLALLFALPLIGSRRLLTFLSCTGAPPVGAAPLVLRC